MKDKLQKSIKRKYIFHILGPLTRGTLENAIESDGIASSTSMVDRCLRVKGANDQNSPLEVFVFLRRRVCE